MFPQISPSCLRLRWLETSGEVDHLLPPPVIHRPYNLHREICYLEVDIGLLFCLLLFIDGSKVYIGTKFGAFSGEHLILHTIQRGAKVTKFDPLRRWVLFPWTITWNRRGRPLRENGSAWLEITKRDPPSYLNVVGNRPLSLLCWLGWIAVC